MRTEPLCDALRKRLAARGGESTVIGGLELLTTFGWAPQRAKLGFPRAAVLGHSINEDSLRIAPWSIAWLERKLRARRRYLRRHGRLR